MQSEHQFTLTTPIKYDSGGEQIEGTFITLTAPSYKQMDKCVALKQAFYRAVSSIQTSDTPSDNPSDNTSADANELTPEGLIGMLYQSDEDMVKILLYGVELFKAPGIAKIDGTVDMTGSLIEKMSQDQLEEMLGCYMVNFILASALSKQGSN